MLNGQFREWALKVAVGVSVTAAGGGWAFLARIDSRVTELEATNRVTLSQVEEIGDDLAEIKQDIRDIPRGEGGMTQNERERLRQMEEDLTCIRGLLSGQRACPPR